MTAKIVVDSSVVAKLFFPELFSDNTVNLFDKAAKSKCQLVAPQLIDYEFGNICWKRVNRNELSSEEAKQVLKDYQKLNIIKINVSSILNDIFPNAIQTQSTFYDCVFL